MGVADISHERSKRAKERIERLREAIVIELEAAPTAQDIETFVDTGGNLRIQLPPEVAARPEDYWLVFRSPPFGDVRIHQNAVAGFLLVIKAHRLADSAAAFSMRDLAAMVDENVSPDGAPLFHFTEIEMNDQQFDAFMEMFRENIGQVSKRIEEGNTNLGKRIDDLVARADSTNANIAASEGRLRSDVAAVEGRLRKDIVDRPSKDYMKTLVGIAVVLAFGAGQFILHWKDIVGLFHR